MQLCDFLDFVAPRTKGKVHRLKKKKKRKSYTNARKLLCSFETVSTVFIFFLNCCYLTSLVLFKNDLQLNIKGNH